MKEFVTHERYTCDCGEGFFFQSMRSNVHACVACGTLHHRHAPLQQATRGFGPTEPDTAHPIASICIVDQVEYEVIGYALGITSDWKFWWYTLKRKDNDELYVMLELPWGVYVFQWSLVPAELLKIGKIELDELVNVEDKQFRAKAIFGVTQAVMRGELIWPEQERSSSWVLLGYGAGYAGLLMDIGNGKVVTLVDPVVQDIQWKTPIERSAHSLQCPNCNNSVALVGGALTMRYGCVHCHSTFDLSEGAMRKLGEWESPLRPILRIGGTAQLMGASYAVLGLVVREIPAFNVNWKEYQLISPQGHHCVLVEMNGHWTLCIGDSNIAHVNIDHRLHHDIVLGDTPHTLFSRDFVDIKYTEGESLFLWAENILYVDYIAPPEGVTFERHETYRLDYRNAYVEVRDIKRQVELARPIPPTYGVGILSEPVLKNQGKSFRYLAMIVLVLAIAEMIWDKTTCSRDLVQSVAIYPRLIGSNPTAEAGEWGVVGADSSIAITRSFDLDEQCNLECLLRAPLVNSYATVEVALINETTGYTEVFYEDLEYYFGVDEGVEWVEGSTEKNFFISSVAPGRYHMEITAEISGWAVDPMYCNVYKDAVIKSNNVLLIVVLVAMFGSVLLIHVGREKRRFRNSEYGPYQT